MTTNSTNSGDAVGNAGKYLADDDLGVDAKYVPEGYKTQKEFIDYALKLYESDMLYDKDNREAALEDLKFAAGEQWDERVKQERIRRNRPCLTINVLPQFIGQVVGDRRMNKVQISVKPLRGATKEAAETRSGLIKSIELYSRAERAYDAACEDQVACGVGYLRADMEYANDDVFEQDIRIKHVPNPLAVVMDRMAVDTTARDAKHAFVMDNIPKEVFEHDFPDAVIPTGFSSGFSDQVMSSTKWVEGNMIRITEFWEIVEKPAILALLQNGDVVDITEEGSEAPYEGQFFIDPRTQKPKIRKTKRTYARMHLITSFAILSECYEIPLTRLPIIRVEGRTIRVGEDRVRFGLTRFAKDSQRLKNYWRSKAAEAIALAPQAQWVADASAVEGREKEFRDNATTGDPLLTYNKNTKQPERVDPSPVPAALLNEANMNQQDIKDTTGLHDASMGIQSNEVSGKAINARKLEGDVATVIYHDNLNQAILELGDVVNQMIPICYDSVRTERIIGNDDKHRMVELNNPDNPQSINIVAGKYDVTLDTGPNFATQREQALQNMTALIQTNPELMQVFGDKVAEHMDWPGATEIAARMKKIIPQNLLSPEEQEEMKAAAGPGQPEADAAQQQAEQQAQQMQQAQLAEAQAQLEHAEQLRQIELQQKTSELASAQQNAKIAEANARRAEAQATEAEAKAHQAAVTADIAPEKAIQELNHSEATHNQNLQQSEDQHIQGAVQTAVAHIQDTEHKDDTHAQSTDLAERAARDKSASSVAAKKDKTDD